MQSNKKKDGESMRYICCRSCLEDKGRREAGESMRSFERLSVSMDTSGTKLTVWCNRHQITVVKIESRLGTIGQGELKEAGG